MNRKAFLKNILAGVAALPALLSTTGSSQPENNHEHSIDFEYVPDEKEAEGTDKKYYLIDRDGIILTDHSVGNLEIITREGFKWSKS